jgi:hypothetical protein
MKKCKGITLMTLIIYVGVLLVVIAVMSSIIENFYQNNTTANENTKAILEFNKFNTYFLKEIKKPGNAVEALVNNNNNNYILFKTGNSFSLQNKIIYYNNIKICDGVENVQFSYGKKNNSDETTDETIIDVKVTFENNFSREIKYKIEEIY